MRKLHELRLNQANALEWETFADHVSHSLPEMRDGLYVFFFVSDLGETVRDNNKGREKTIIHRSGASLKPGKFEGGLIRRLANYQEHLHWVDTRGKQHFVFTKCFRFGLVLDLTNCELGLPSAARVFERYWVDSLIHFIDTERLWAPVPQLARSEWKFVTGAAWSDATESRLLDFMTVRAERVLKMAEVARGPAGLR